MTTILPILVDTNVHVIAPPELRSTYPLNIFPGTESEFTEDQTNTPEGFLQRMAEAGVQQAYLMASRFHGFDNSYCANAIANSPPGYFVGVANIDIFDPHAPDTISYWIEQRGLHGVRFWGGGPVAGHRFPGDERGLANFVDDPKYLPAWERVRDLGIPSNAQATMPEVLPNTRRLLERLPQLPFTLNNLAHVPANQGAESEPARDLLALAEFPRVFVNFSVNFVKQSTTNTAARELLLALVERFGARRLMWSAFGQPLDQAVRILNEGLAPLSEEDRAGVLGEGARDLYPHLRTEVAP
jgi:predicted TIM-barrel fold metal-dependent hydrolase